MKLHPESHLDHGLPQAVVDEILARFAARDAFFIETIEVSQSLPCALHGPAVGESPVGEAEATYETRGERAWPSRMCSRAPSRTTLVTVIGGPHEGECILYTAYPGPCAPREPGDPALSGAELEAAKVFWAHHALGR
jgi:hypothetical protein